MITVVSGASDVTGVTNTRAQRPDTGEQAFPYNVRDIFKGCVSLCFLMV